MDNFNVQHGDPFHLANQYLGSLVNNMAASSNGRSSEGLDNSVFMATKKTFDKINSDGVSKEVVIKSVKELDSKIERIDDPIIKVVHSILAALLDRMNEQPDESKTSLTESQEGPALKEDSVVIDSTQQTIDEKIMEVAGIALEDLNKIRSHLEGDQREIKQHVKKRKEGNLKASAINIPSGPFAGRYITLSKKLGHGIEASVRPIINIDTGELRVKRGSPHEADGLLNDINALLMNDTEHFVCGDLIGHIGNMKTPWGEKIIGIKIDSHILEYMENGTLKDYLLNPDPDMGKRLQIAIKTAECLKILHGHGLLHLDIKTDNILLDGKLNPKLADFGHANKNGAQLQRHLIGAVKPPESYLGGNSVLEANSAIDIWAFGLMLSEVFNKGSWYRDQKILMGSKESRESIADEFERLKDKHFQNRHADPIEMIIDQCLQFDPKNRPDIETVLNSLKKIT
jgi:hypothetical protein